MSQNEIGDALAQQGKWSEALTAYRASLAIRERRAQTDPGDAQTQRDLCVSQIKIGDALAQQGKGSEALVAYRASLAIAERLAQTDPADAQSQRDLIVSLVNISETSPKDAAPSLTRALTIAKRLDAEQRLAPAYHWMLVDLEKRLAKARRSPRP